MREKRSDVNFTKFLVENLLNPSSIIKRLFFHQRTDSKLECSWPLVKETETKSII